MRGRLNHISHAFRSAHRAGGAYPSAPFLVLAAFVILLTGAAPIEAQSEITLVLPTPGPGISIPDSIKVRINLHFGIDPGDGAAPPSLGTVNLGELSPINLSGFASGTIRIRIYSPFGFVPPYTVRARTFIPPDRTVGNFNTNDIGMGIRGIVASLPRVNGNYDYDPRLVGKNIDDEPNFAGTVGGLPTGSRGHRLYRTRGWYVGRWNYFTLVFAVAPQFYTPSASVDAVLELELML